MPKAGLKEIFTGFPKNIQSLLLQFIVGMTIDKIGRWWHKGEEVDIVAINECEKLIAFFGVKWSRLSHREAEKILNALRDKAELVNWHSGMRTDYYGIIAEGIEGKEELRKQGFLIYNIKDFGLH